MGKTAERPKRRHPENGKLSRLKGERRKLAARLEIVDVEIARLSEAASAKNPPSAEAVDQWFDELSRGLPDLPPLPGDFSRADLYDDHD